MKKLKLYLNYLIKFSLSKHKVLILNELISYIRYYGFSYGIWHFFQSKDFFNTRSNYYHSWFVNVHLPKLDELEKQRTHKFDYAPLISIVVPIYNTPGQFLIEMLESIIAQTYSNWELCIADGASSAAETLDILRNYITKDTRIRVIFLSENYHISGNTNQALKITKGEYVGFFDHDDLLTPNCLYEYVNSINQFNKPAMLYCDEDKVSADSKRYSNPTFKPAYAPDTLRSSNYICHWLVIRKDILDQVGWFDSICDGAQDYDMVLRVVDITQDIIHIPKVLYHWRVHSASTSSSLSRTKPYTHDAGMYALTKHLQRNNLLSTVEDGVYANMYKVNYTLSSFPLVSIVILITKDTKKLCECIDSISKITTYTNYEIILIKQSTIISTMEFTQFKYRYPQLKIELYQTDLTAISAMNNLGITHANGEYIMFMNSNTRVITANWLQEMLMYAKRSDVGAVGAKLYYPDHSIYNGGLIVGAGSMGVGTYVHHNAPKLYRGYNHLLLMVHNLSAVALNGMMIEKSKLCKINAFDDGYEVAFADIDLCLRLRKAGYLAVWVPYAQLLFYSKEHLNYSNEYEKEAEFQADLGLFKEKHGFYLNDPYYNINLGSSDETYLLFIKPDKICSLS